MKHLHVRSSRRLRDMWNAAVRLKWWTNMHGSLVGSLKKFCKRLHVMERILLCCGLHFTPWSGSIACRCAVKWLITLRLGSPAQLNMLHYDKMTMWQRLLDTPSTLEHATSLEKPSQDSCLRNIYPRTFGTYGFESLTSPPLGWRGWSKSTRLWTA